MSLTIYEVLCNARYNLENAVFPFQIEMAKEQLANALDAIDNGKTLNDVWEEAQPNAAVPYKPTLTPPNEWVSVEERLPENSERWETYIVTVNRSHWPTSSYDPCDAPYDEELVVSAQYDSKQKIWHLPWDEQLNALIQADDAPINGDFVTHWMPLPAPPDSRQPEGEEGDANRG